VTCVSSTSLAVSVDSPSASSEQGCEQLPSAKSSHTPDESSPSTGQLFPVTGTSESSPQDDSRPIVSALTSSAEDSPARTLASRAQELGWQASAAVYGRSSPDLLADYNHDSSSWRTRQACLVSGWAEFSETWPRSGMTRNGTAYRLPALTRITRETASGLLPTPTAQGFSRMSSAGGAHARQKWVRMLPTMTVKGNYNRKGASSTSGDGLATVLKRILPTMTAHVVRGGAKPERSDKMTESSARGFDLASTLRTVFPESTGIINPSWGEGFMGFPTGWTELTDSEMPSSRKSRKSSGGQS
jgi:hypothetical protein